MAAKMAVDVSDPMEVDDAPKCPFGFTGANPHQAQQQAPALPAALAETVKVMSERGGLAPEAIAATLNLDVEKVKATLARRLHWRKARSSRSTSRWQARRVRCGRARIDRADCKYAQRL